MRAPIAAGPAGAPRVSKPGKGLRPARLGAASLRPHSLRLPSIHGRWCVVPARAGRGEGHIY